MFGAIVVKRERNAMMSDAEITMAVRNTKYVLHSTDKVLKLMIQR